MEGRRDGRKKTDERRARRWFGVGAAAGGGGETKTTPRFKCGARPFPLPVLAPRPSCSSRAETTRGKATTNVNNSRCAASKGQAIRGPFPQQKRVRARVCVCFCVLRVRAEGTRLEEQAQAQASTRHHALLSPCPCRWGKAKRMDGEEGAAGLPACQ